MPAQQQRIDHGEAVLDRLVEQAAFLARDGVVLDEELGESHRAERQAPGALGLLAAGGDQLGRPPADVEEERALRGRSALQDAQADQARFLGAGDDLDIEPGGRPYRAQQLGPIRGLADRAGRHRADPLRAGALRELGESLHRHRAGGDGLGGEPSGAEHLRAEPHGGAILGAHRQRPVPLRVGDLQPHRVRSEIDDGEGLGGSAPLHPAMRKSTTDGTSGRISTGRPE